MLSQCPIDKGGYARFKKSEKKKKRDKKDRVQNEGLLKEDWFRESD